MQSDFAKTVLCIDLVVHLEHNILFMSSGVRDVLIV